MKKVFLSMDAGLVFDIINGDYTTFGSETTIIMNRVSTEFDREQWSFIFRKMHDEGIENVIFVPTGLDTPKTMWNERIAHIKNKLYGRKDVFCGWLYSEDEFLGMFSGEKNEPMYSIRKRVPVEETAVYFLERNANQ